MWALSDQLKNMTTHKLSVEDVSIEWTVKKYDYIHAKNRRCEYWVSS